MLRIFLSVLLMMSGFLNAQKEILSLDVIPYEKLVAGDGEALKVLNDALYQKGIVGIRGVPGHKEKYERFIEAAKTFSALPEEIKQSYKPNRSLGETFLGYEEGKEKFQRPNGEWVIDNLKSSYYAYIPNSSQNKWPLEIDLRVPFQDLGESMTAVGELIMYKIGLLGESTNMHLGQDSRLGRMLHYRKSDDNENPYWCGAHFDHSLFTAILPAVYFVEGKQVSEPEEAGLFIRTPKEITFKKVFADDLDVMMFQVGEFGQIIMNDGIQATEHCVQKAAGAVERYTLAVFHDAPMDVPICSTSVLTNDLRYRAKTGEYFTYRHWTNASFERYLVKNDK